jgi:CHAD domain-containing protein
VRDADVLLERVEAYCEDAFGQERNELERLRKLLRKRAKRMRRKLTRELQR